MTTPAGVEMGRQYYITIPVADDGAPDDHEVNRVLGRPDCALDYDVTPLDSTCVTVCVVGLLTAGNEPAVLVDCGPVGMRLIPAAWLAEVYPDRRDPRVPLPELPIPAGHRREARVTASPTVRRPPR
ncbi:hypothetical protein [Phytoactinopolyspora limicola]|uniref:hypothetical protein n=1 Tax=Phytoactinopolyspora limicola TaxID=2715536 RepID=UPI00140A510D|nr:hypothetical protein [Phytoactinopolyspora limicola]